MIRRTFIASLFALGFGGSHALASAPLAIPGATTVDAEAIISLITDRPDLVIIDNRRAEDYANGFIEGAVRVLDTEMTEAVLASHVRTKDTPVLFYCNGLNCGRAAKAAEMAVRWGYSQVFYYALGMDEWRMLGLPLAAP